MSVSVLMPVPRERYNVIVVILVLLLIYFIIMDIVLFRKLQLTTLVNEVMTKDEVPSTPFSPLTTKLLTSDELSQFVNEPTTIAFNKITKFSSIFYFITPNMISFCHVGVAFLAGKLVASERIRTRWLGLVAFEFRCWVDGLDGVVARERTGQMLYQSQRSTMGHFVDVVCDVTGSAFLCFGVLFFLWKQFDKNRADLLSARIKIDGIENGLSGSHVIQTALPSRSRIFWKMVCYGALIALGSACWDTVTAQLEDLFEKPLDDIKLARVQTEFLHAPLTSIVFLLWRLLQGEKFLQLLVVAVALDKVWEYISAVQYWGFLVVVCVAAATECYIYSMTSVLYNAVQQ